MTEQSLPKLYNPQPDNVHSYMIVASDIIPSLKVLSQAKIQGRGFHILACMCLECMIKAYIIFKELPMKKHVNELRTHNLIKLWKMAGKKEEVPLVQDFNNNPPAWVKVLSYEYKRYRYQVVKNEIVVNGAQTVQKVDTYMELKRLFCNIKNAIKWNG